MTAPPSLRVVSAELHELEVEARLPFRYGVGELSRFVHTVLEVEVEGRGWRARGVAAENLAPKWFSKDPETSYEQDLVDLRGTCRRAAEVAPALGEVPSVFALRAELLGAQRGWAEERGAPALLANLGPSLVERAAIDAVCRGLGTTFATAVRGDALGLELGALHPELSGARAADLLPDEPLARVAVRHTVGLSDPLIEADLGPDAPDDGLPRTLLEVAQTYGLRWLKVKVSGELDADLARLRRLAALSPLLGADLAVTLDGNEVYPDVATLREHVAAWRADERVAPLLARLAYLEQPLRREVALEGELEGALADWPDAPPLVADESVAGPDDARRALDLGYRGLSAKACKGVLSCIANACLVAHRRRCGASDLLLTAEDLTTIGPYSLNQDLALVATLGVEHVERNGHHYVRGLSAWPAEVQEAALGAHPDLFALHPLGYAALSVVEGELSLESVAAAPFGVGL
jgi:hypothetical protein